MQENPKGGTTAPAVAKNPSAPEGVNETGEDEHFDEINFKQLDHKSRIVLLLTEEPKFESSTLSENMIAVEIKNAFVPKHLQRGLDTSDFESVVNYINYKNVKAGKANDIRILVKLREECLLKRLKRVKLFLSI